MKNITAYIICQFLITTTLCAQYTGGIGRGDAVSLLSSSALPVELSSFSAVQTNGAVQLQWKTATEKNNYGFEIERIVIREELGRMHWNRIGFVEGHGTTGAVTVYTYKDEHMSNGKCSYRLKQIDRDGNYEYSQQIDVSLSIPKEFALMQNYPNPFNPTTVIGFQLSQNGKASLTIYDALGRQVATLMNEMKEPGAYSVTFDAAKYPSGLYVARLTSNGVSKSRKLLLVK